MGTFVKISSAAGKEDENRHGTFVELSTGKEIARNPDPPGGSPVTVKKVSAKNDGAKKKAVKSVAAKKEPVTVPARVQTKAEKTQKPVQKTTKPAAPKTDPSAYGWDPMIAQDLQNREAQGMPAKKSPMPVTGAYAQLQNQARQAAADLDTEALARANDAMKAMRAAAGKQTAGDRVSDTASAVFSGSAGSLANLAGFAVNAYNDPAYYRRQIARMQAELAAGKTSDGVPLNDAKRRALQQAIASMEAEAARQERPDSLTSRIYRKADTLQTDSERFQTQAKQGLGPTGSLLVDAGVSMGQSALDNAVGAVTGTGLLPFTLRAFGGASQEARRSGADVSQQLVYGSAQAAKEYVTEKLFGLTGPQRLTGGGSLDGLIESGIRNVTERLSKTPAGQKALGGLLTWLASGATEGLEETIGSILESTLINPNLRQWDPDTRTARQKFEDGLYETLVGAVSGLMGGVRNLGTYQVNSAGPGPAGGVETAPTPTPAPESGGEQSQRREAVGQLLDLMRQVQAQKEAEYAHRTAQEAAQGPQTGQRVSVPGPAPDAVQGPLGATESAGGSFDLTGDQLVKIIQQIQAEQDAKRAPGLETVPENQPDAPQPDGARLDAPPLPDQLEQDLERTAQAQHEENIRDAMNRLVPPGKHIDTSSFSQEDFDLLAEASERGEIGVDAQGWIFRVDPENHIDQRDPSVAGSRKVNAFQYDHPDLHRFFADAANWLKGDLALGQRGGEIQSSPRTASDGVTPSVHDRYSRTSRVTSEPIARLLDSGMSYARIEKALDAIIHDRGQENFADAKRVELVLDDMLSNGYKGLDGMSLPGIEEYVEAKSKIAGSLDADAAPLTGEQDAKRAQQTTATETQKAALTEGAAVNENGLKALTEQEKTNLSSGKKNKVVSTFEEAIHFVRNALKNRASSEKAYLGKIPDAVAERIFKETGFDVSGFHFILPSDNIRHIIKNHGDVLMESARGQIAVTPEDIANLPKILSNPDRIYLSTETDRRGRPVIVFEKVLNGNHITMQAVSNGTHSLQTDTLRIGKTKNPQGTEYYDAGVLSDPAHNVQSVPPQGPLSEFTLPQSASDVNSGSQAFVDPDAPVDDGVGAANTHFDQLGVAEERYGTLPKGENPVRPDDIPAQTTDAGKVSLLARTIKGAGVVPDSFVPVLEQAVLDGRFSYIPHTNAQAAAEAVKSIEYKGWTQALADFHSDVARGRASDTLTAIGVELANNAVNSGDITAALNIFTDLQQAARNAGQAVQAVRMLKQAAPAHRLYMIQKSVQEMVDSMHLPEGSVTLDPELLKSYLNAETEKARDAVISDIQQAVADQLPSSLLDQWTALRYVNMLDNFRTQGRNLLGNVGMQGIRAVKDRVAAGMEAIYHRINPQSERTKTFTADRSLRDAARADYVNVADVALGQGKYQEGLSDDAFQRGVQDRRTIFKNNGTWGTPQGRNAFLCSAPARGRTADRRRRESRPGGIPASHQLGHDAGRCNLYKAHLRPRPGRLPQGPQHYSRTVLLSRMAGKQQRLRGQSQDVRHSGGPGGHLPGQQCLLRLGIPYRAEKRHAPSCAYGGGGPGPLPENACQRPGPGGGIFSAGPCQYNL